VIWRKAVFGHLVLSQKQNVKQNQNQGRKLTMNENDEGFIHPKPHTDPRATANIEGRWYYPEEIEQVERQNDARRAESDKKTREVWEASPEGKLCMALYEAFQAYRRYLEQNPHARQTRWGAKVGYNEHILFENALHAVEDHKREREEKSRKNLEKAQAAARCEHEYLSGRRCKAPRLKGRKLCRMHERLEEARTEKLDLGTMEDADSIQVGIKKLQGAIIEGTLDARQVGQLAYTIQLAAWNVGRTSMNSDGRDQKSSGDGN
jgi:hypothetical protein